MRLKITKKRPLRDFSTFCRYWAKGQSYGFLFRFSTRYIGRFWTIKFLKKKSHRRRNHHHYEFHLESECNGLFFRIEIMYTILSNTQIHSNLSAFIFLFFLRFKKLLDRLLGAIVKIKRMWDVYSCFTPAPQPNRN